MPTASEITVREVLAKFDGDFASVARAVENGEFALWVGSGISRQAPNLGDLIERAFDFVRARAIEPATTASYLPSLHELLELSEIAPNTVVAQFGQPLADWPEHDAIIGRLWNQYSRVLDIRVEGEAADFILWEAIDIRAAFENPHPPSSEHLCIAILILEGAVRTVASANWDGFIEAAVARLSNGTGGVLQVVVDPNQLRAVAGRASLLKFHGCILYATQEPETFRKYLTGSRTQIMGWPEEPLFAAMCSSIVNLATAQKTLVLGLSIQDNNLQSIFARAKNIHPWPWPCAPQAPGHVFCEDQIKPGQRDVLRIVYGDNYNDNIAEIHASAHLRAWGEQVLIALVLKLIADKLNRLMELYLAAIGKPQIADTLRAPLVTLRNAVADPAVGDRTAFTNRAILLWSRLLSLFRRGALPSNAESYEALSGSTPDMIDADANAEATGLGRLALALALLEHGRTIGQWELKVPSDATVAAGAMTARASRPDATDRPLFVVKSATEAIALMNAGAFGAENAVVVHADNAWRQLAGGDSSARRVRVPPGRTGRVGTTHISLGDLVAGCGDAASLQQGFVTEMML